MKTLASARVALVCLSLLMAAAVARGEILLDTGLVTFSPTGTEFGRLSRNGVSSDWATTKPFPGVIGAPAPRAYEAFTISSNLYSFLQITLDDPSVSFIDAAYLGSFTPVNTAPNYGLDVNYLGDPGFSEPAGNPSFFQIVAALGTTVVIPIAEVNQGGGAGRPFELIVEGFFDTEYNDASTVPEPSYLILLGCACAAIALLRSKRRIA